MKVCTVVSPTHRPLLSAMKYSWFSFLLEAESTPGAYCGRKDYVNKNSSETIGNRTRDLPTWRAVPLTPTRWRFDFTILPNFYAEICNNSFQEYAQL